jgi:hypothetical protein
MLTPMKYYLVNFILLDNRIITLNENIGIGLHSYANIEEFKESIVSMNMVGVEKEKVVIRSYKQISKEAFNCLSTTTC